MRPIKIVNFLNAALALKSFLITGLTEMRFASNRTIGMKTTQNTDALVDYHD